MIGCEVDAALSGLQREIGTRALHMHGRNNYMRTHEWCDSSQFSQLLRLSTQLPSEVNTAAIVLPSVPSMDVPGEFQLHSHPDAE